MKKVELTKVEMDWIVKQAKDLIKESKMLMPYEDKQSMKDNIDIMSALIKKLK